MEMLHNKLSIAVHRIHLRLAFCCLFLTSGMSVAAQISPYVGAIGGIATLSADAGSQGSGQGLNLSSYAPRNGGALDVFAGAHLHNYFSVQANYIWNRNSLRLNSTSSRGGFYQEDRSSTQQAAVFDLLVYFRQRSNRIRPYLATGTGVVHLSSTQDRLIASEGSTVLPPARFSSTGPLLRVHVGIDLRLARKVDFRYSFSEMIEHNEIGRQLSPPGTHKLMNFQNLFGFVVRL
jgi:hypothetical protein